mmetsp:Transcript_31706/g.67192  ORF Transcript_31706/g.67192 Transcript_31706/m.67192 type:complete len:207 (+) Transcript_31706:164-784(+)
MHRHCPRSLRCQNQRRRRQSRLIIVFPTQETISNPISRESIDHIGTIKMQIRHVEISVKIKQFFEEAFVRRGYRNDMRCSIPLVGIAQSGIERIEYPPLRFFSPELSGILLMIRRREQHQIVIDRKGNGISVPRPRRKAIGIQPHHVFVIRQRRMSPEVPGAEFGLPVVVDSPGAFGPPVDFAEGDVWFFWLDTASGGFDGVSLEE